MKRFLPGDTGSLTLEATIVFPVFLGFILLLINFIKVAMVYVAMDHAVSETTKLVAVHAYPLKYLQDTPAPDKTGSQLAQVVGRLASFQAGSGAETGAAAGSGLVQEISDQLTEKGAEYLTNTGLKLIVRKKIKELYPLGKLTDRDFTITYLQICSFCNPDGSSGSMNGRPLNDKDIGITVKYKVRLPVTFLPLREISLSNSAVERAWLDN